MFLKLDLIFARMARRNSLSKSASRDRAQWDNKAVWYRLRYHDNLRAQEMLSRLSRAAGRVSLRIRSGDALRCWVGIDPRYASVMQKMAAAFSCELTPETPPAMWVGVFHPATNIPDDHSTDAYIVDGNLFVTLQGNNNTDGTAFPSKKQNEIPVAWKMPHPSLGLTTTAPIDLPSTPTLYRHNGSWLFGWDVQGHSVGQRQAGVMGQPEYVHRWLSSFVLASLQERSQDNPVIFIDGTGMWLDQFLKTTQVATAVNSRMVRLIDIRQQQHAFNPLAYTLSGNHSATMVRWMWWLKGMGLADDGLKWAIPHAMKHGVQTLPELYQWLKERRGEEPKLAVPLMDKIEQLNDDPEVREWLLATERFSDPRQWIKQTPLLVTARLNDTGGNGWARMQGLRALLALVIEVNAAIVLHEVKRLSSHDKMILKNKKLVVTNSPGNVTIITRCDAPMAQAIRHRLALDISEEYLQLLPPGNAVITNKEDLTAVSWRDNL